MFLSEQRRDAHFVHFGRRRWLFDEEGLTAGFRYMDANESFAVFLARALQWCVQKTDIIVDDVVVDGRQKSISITMNEGHHTIASLARIICDAFNLRLAITTNISARAADVIFAPDKNVLLDALGDVLAHMLRDDVEVYYTLRERDQIRIMLRKERSRVHDMETVQKIENYIVPLLRATLSLPALSAKCFHVLADGSEAPVTKRGIQ